MRLPSLLAALVLILANAGSPAEDRVPVPKADDQKAAQKIIRDLFKEEFARKKAADMLDLASKLRQQAEETKDDPASRFVLFREARDLAAKGGDVGLAMHIVDTLATEFAVSNVAELRVGALELAEPTANATNGRDIAEYALVAVSEAITADDFDLAARLVKVAQSSASKGKSVALATAAAGRASEIESVKKEFDATRKDAATLKSKPSDADANLTVGKFLCFFKGGWDEGLPLLVRGSDAKLTALAEKDRDGPATAPEQVEVADSWYTLADGQTEAVVKTELQLRALRWYREAIGGATGLTKTKVEKRLTELEKLAERRGRKRDWVVIFRSDDPSIWDKDVSKGYDQQAMSLKKVPEKIKYLKMTEMKGRDFVIIEMSNDLLGKFSADGKVGWEGRSHLAWSGRHLGIWSREMREMNGRIILIYPGIDQYGGYGFGHEYGVDKEQGYTWAGKKLPKTVIEIAVKTIDLSPAETMKLIKKK